MDIKEIRRHNARLLANRFKTMSRFADAIDQSATYVSRLIGKNPTKAIGGKVAREIEESFDKPHGWLDTYRESLDDQNNKEVFFSKQSATVSSDNDTPISQEKKETRPTVVTSFQRWRKISELEHKAAALLAEAEDEQHKLEKQITSEVEGILAEQRLTLSANIYRNSFDTSHPEWKRIILYIPYKEDAITIYENDLEAINPDALFIALPSAPSHLDLFVVEKEHYGVLLRDHESAPGIRSIEIDTHKKTINTANLENFSNLNERPDGWGDWF
ncbi:hypothetical protein [Endozoicomonas lisbonensis]